MPQTMSASVRPYQWDQVITEQGGSTTLNDAKTATDVEVNTKLPYPCPQCGGLDAGRGLIVVDGLNYECPTCAGWGNTETPLEVQRNFPVNPNIPTQAPLMP